MVLADRTISRLLDEGRIEIDPYDSALLQPSSVDVRVDRFFRVFHNNRYPFIDVKVEQAELTELVEEAGVTLPDQTGADLVESSLRLDSATWFNSHAGNALLADHDARMLAEAKASGLGKGGNVSPSVPDGLGAIPPQLQEIIDRNAMLITQAWFDALM